MRTQLAAAILCALVLAGLAPQVPECSAQIVPGGASVVERQLAAKYQGKTLTLRQFYSGSRLRFRSDGHLIGAGSVGPWTLDAQVEITEVGLQDQLLTLRGNRLFLVFDPISKQLRDATRIAPDDLLSASFHWFATKQWMEFVEGTDVEIEVELAASPKDEADVIPALNAVFLTPSEDFAEFVPEFWKAFVLMNEGKSQPRLSGRQALKVGKDVSAPRALHAPDPEYTEAARHSGYQTKLVLWVVVNQDGTVRELQIARPAGLGLDERAVEAVKQWRFDPALKDGSPVAVQVNIEVSFRLY